MKENSKNRAYDRLTNSSMKTISMEFMLCRLLKLGSVHRRMTRTLTLQHSLTGVIFSKGSMRFAIVVNWQRKSMTIKVGDES